MKPLSRRLGALLLPLLLAACGGGGGDTSAPPPAAAASDIGVAGGALEGPSGSRVVVPAGALAASTRIGIEQTASGAPPLPVGITAFGPVFALTPHGTRFAAAVTVTLPFDPATVPAGTAPVLYKTNDTQTAWDVVSGAVVSGNRVSAAITGFSYAVVATPPVVLSNIVREWFFDEFYATKIGKHVHDADNVLSGFHELQASHDWGPLFYSSPRLQSLEGQNAVGKVFSNETGHTYWVSGVAPRATAENNFATGAETKLVQTQYWTKMSPDATLRYVLTQVLLEAASDESRDPRPCTAGELWRPTWCLQSNAAQVQFELLAVSTSRHKQLVDLGMTATLSGWQGHFELSVDRTMSSTPIANHTNFDYSSDLYADGGRHSIARLAAPIRIDIPLDHVAVGETFYVKSIVAAYVRNDMQGESYYAAFLRDPLSVDGAEIVAVGLAPAAAPGGTPVDPPADPLPACAEGPDPAAGTLQFTTGAFNGIETGRAPVFVSRTGGSKGAVSVLFATRDGSATADVDYSPVSGTVLFGDGEDGTRVVYVPITPDALAEADETVNLALSDARGCAAVGARSTAVLTIVDDDAHPASFTIGGTVSGLVGSGLVLHDQGGGDTVTVGNGTFTLPTARPDGAPYDLRVQTQPSAPLQSCSVAQGVGTIAGADVSNITVDCAAPLPNGTLDATFGSGGKVATNIAFAPNVAGAAIGMALQDDGRILLVGGLKLLRVNPDGTPDLTFGTSGVVNVPFNGSLFDLAQAVAVQADGKIVVAGAMSVGGQDDFALARFNVDGTLDASFGNGGLVTTDFSGSTDRVRRLVIQSDGKIIAAGFATIGPLATANADFAAARYNTNGGLDTGFGAAGRVRDEVLGRVDWAQGVAIQADGKIVLAGRAGVDGGTDPDVGLVRYHGDTDGNGSVTQAPGWRDESFGLPQTGIVSSNLGLLGGWEEATDLVVLADGSLLVACQVRLVGAAYNFGLARFGTVNDIGGVLLGGGFTDISGQSDRPRSMALQADGKVVVVGQSGSSSTNPNMAIVRYTSDLRPDTSFGAGGIVTLDFFGAIDGAEAVAVQADGRIVVGGFARNGGTTVFALARLLP
jgi:uncharacterized delta-60 repeat protein